MKFAAQTPDGRFTGAIYDAVTAEIRAHHAAFGEALIPVSGLAEADGPEGVSFAPIELTINGQRELAVVSLRLWIDRFLSQFTEGVPPVEIASWPTKAIAAAAHLAGKPQDMIKAEALLTGEDPDDLAATIVAKANLYTSIIAQMTGLRRMAFQAIAAANTAGQVQAALDDAFATSHDILADLGLAQEN
jgi:hypothetical protein